MVRIGSKIWTAQNLNYRSDNSWCYANDPAACTTYGRLYDHEAAKTACPSGWHLPTDEEWNAMTDEIGGMAGAGSTLKSSGGWNISGGGEDIYGFRILPAGGSGSGNFKHLGYHAFFWSSTLSSKDKSWYWNFSRDASAYRGTEDLAKAFSVRCVQN